MVLAQAFLYIELNNLFKVDFIIKNMKIPGCNSKCSSCEKRLCYLLDHTRIYINSIQLFELAKDAKFPYVDMMPFLLPISESTNPAPPEQVINFFKNNEEAKEFSYQDWDWKLMPRQDEIRDLKDHRSIAEKIKDHFSLKKENSKEDWQYGIYMRSRKDVRQIIIDYTKPFLEKIKSLERQEIDISSILPTDCDKRNFPFRIDSTNYYLSLRDITPKLEQKKSNVASLDLVLYGPGSVSSVLTCARLAILEYQGR